MKTSVFFLFVFIFESMAMSLEIQDEVITLKSNSLSIGELISEIEKQSDYLIVYSTREIDINRKVSVKNPKEKVSTILKEAFEKTDIGYEFTKDYILLSTKKNLSENNATQPVPSTTVTGTVIDENGEPAIGAKISVVGKSIGTSTDTKGYFSVNTPLGSIIQVSYLGYVTQTITATDRVLNIVLKEDTKTLDEVVVVGYGTQKRRDLTGSVSSVSASQLRDIPVTSAAQAITGRMAGVQVTQTEGSPDAEIKIRIRGGGSLTQDNSPLYIVDGFPVDNINDIAPTDIASIDVLKDASSTAIYGARGANGVIIVSTKSGYEGKPKVSYNMYYGTKKITGYYDVLDAYEYVDWQWEFQMLTSSNNFTSLERTFGNFQDIGLYKEMSSTNWQKKILGQNGSSLNNNLSVSGGTKATKYHISLTRSDEDEIMLGQGYDRTNLSAKTAFQINDRLSLDLNIRMSDYNLEGAGTSSGARLNHMVQFRPVNGLSGFIEPDDEFEMDTEFILDPLKQTNDDYRRTKRLTFNYDAAANIKILKDLIYRFEYGYQYSMNTNKRFYGLNTSNAQTWGSQPLASNEKTDGKGYRIANTLTYNKRDFLPEHNLTVMLGEELIDSKSENLYTEVRYLPKYIDAISALSMMQLGSTQPITTYDSPNVITSSFFGRLNYDYKGKYLASATFRTDGSSKFAPGHRWGYFPSAALAWRISDERFMEVTNAWMSNLKLRLSYGTAGNNRIGNDLWKKTFSIGGDGLLFMEGNETTSTTYLIPGNSLSNPDLKWETTITQNVGLDFGFFKDRLSGSVEVYKNITKDLLIRATVPSSSGYTTQMQNIGQTSNRGIEFVLNGTIIQTHDFQLSANFNIAFNKNHIDKLGENKRWEESSGWAGTDGSGPTGDYLIEEGGQIGLMYGFVTDGMYTFDDFYYDDTTGTYKLKPGVADNRNITTSRIFWPGALKYVNQNPGEGETDAEKVSVDQANDRVIIGNANPKHTGGFGLNGQYKGFDMSVFCNWVYGNDIYNANKLEYTASRSGRTYKNLLTTMNPNDRFSYLDRTTGLLITDWEQLKEMNKNATIWSPAHSLTRLHSWAVEDGSFLRLNNLTIGYSLPSSLLSKIKVEQLRIYVTGYNLWVWTNYSGYDPEVDTRRSTPLTPGVDYNAYPRSRSYNVGLNLTF
ncbi:MAG: TonB-dependent receptor [Dysgonamonadaceae bacterium]|nr:TonB-dependent receptor [Dysgonamonadaceae bacterium]